MYVSDARLYRTIIVFPFLFFLPQGFRMTTLRQLMVHEKSKIGCLLVVVYRVF